MCQVILGGGFPEKEQLMNFLENPARLRREGVNALIGGSHFQQSQLDRHKLVSSHQSRDQTLLYKIQNSKYKIPTQQTQLGLLLTPEQSRDQKLLNIKNFYFDQVFFFRYFHFATLPCSFSVPWIVNT